MTRSPSVPDRVRTRLGEWAIYRPRTGGTPLLLWPSLFTDHRLYGRLVDRLDAGWSPVLVDGPGFGASDPPRPEVQPGQYAAALVDALDALGLDRVVAAGTSWGGQIVAHLAARHPSRVDAALLMNTPVAPSRTGNLAIVLGAAAIGSTRLYARGVARAMLAPTSRQDPALVEEVVGPIRSFDRAAMARTASTTLRRFPGIQPVLADVAVPTGVLVGAQDRLYPASSLEADLPANPHLEVSVLPDCGHLAPLEAPAAVAGHLDALRSRAVA